MLVHHPNSESEKIAAWQVELTSAMSNLSKEQQENAVRQFLSMAAAMTNHKRLQLLLSLLENLVVSNVLPARYALSFYYGSNELTRIRNKALAYMILDSFASVS